MGEIPELLEFARHVVVEAANEFVRRASGDLKRVTGLELSGRETKLVADAELEAILLERLLPTGLSVLSEETGFIERDSGQRAHWVIDPLDGSVNYLRGLGPSAISVALWRDEASLFGIVFSLNDRSLAWGGRGFGAYVDGVAIEVSAQSRADQAVLCTGIPARLALTDAFVASRYINRISRFAKVRMIGSAACSLVLVARGAADAYFEDQIMLWDIAAGLAIVEGAGGAFGLTRAPGSWICSVHASNPGLLPALAAETDHQP